jgi:hypothetical protein
VGEKVWFMVLSSLQLYKKIEPIEVLHSFRKSEIMEKCHCTHCLRQHPGKAVILIEDQSFNFSHNFSRDYCCIWLTIGVYLTVSAVKETVAASRN